MKDPIVQEVRDARAAIAAEFDYDLDRIFAWAKTKEASCKIKAFPEENLPGEPQRGSNKDKPSLMEFLLSPAGAAPDGEPRPPREVSRDERFK